MAGLDPAIQQHIEGAVFFIDGRIKCGHDSGIFPQAPVFFTHLNAGIHGGQERP
jgi:hypothetical protein